MKRFVFLILSNFTIITYNSEIEINKIIKSNTNAGIIKGENDYLFLAEDTNNEILYHYIDYPQYTFDKYKNLITKRINFFNQKNLNFYWFVCPDKSSILKQLLPNELKNLESKKNISKIIEIGKQLTFNTFFDLTEYYQLKKHTYDLFYKYDTHHNFYGAYFAYQAIINTLMNFNKLIYPPIELYQLKKFQRIMHGDLSKRLKNFIPEISEVLYLENIPYKFIENIPEEYHLNYRKAIITEIPNKNLPSCIIFRDSFTENMIYLLAQHFRRAVFIWRHGNLDYEIIKKESPDIVIQIMVERFFSRCPDL